MVNKDRRIWHFNKDGEYTVRLAYRVVMEMLVSKNDFKVRGEWRKMWNLKIPPKVKTFLWRACQDTLPKKVKLQSRGVAVSLTYVMCDYAMENACPYVIGCWKQAKLDEKVENIIAQAESFIEFI
ncbi:hypothetical protein DITRI_Ditri12bG0139200 [Diplodiscus trichospermus]